MASKKAQLILADFEYLKKETGNAKTALRLLELIHADSLISSTGAWGLGQAEQAGTEKCSGQ